MPSSSVPSPTRRRPRRRACDMSGGEEIGGAAASPLIAQQFISPVRVVGIRTPHGGMLDGLQSSPFVDRPPASPFSGFAANLPNLNSLEKKSCTHNRSAASPYSSLANSLANLESSPSISTPAQPSWSFDGNNTPGSSMKGSMEVSPTWQLSDGISRARRALIGEVGDNASCFGYQLSPIREISHGIVEVENRTPQTPSMKLGTFHDTVLPEGLSAHSTPAEVVGSYEQFLAHPETSKVESKPLVRHARTRSRRKLECRMETTNEPSQHDSDLEASGAGARKFQTSKADTKRKSDWDAHVWEADSQPVVFAQKDAGLPLPRDPSKLCKCKRSRCIRQYCICFRAGELCQGCDCVDCFNDGQHEEERKAAVDHIKTSDPLAFHEKVAGSDESAMDISSIPAPATVEDEANRPPIQHHVRGCKCKNSKCVKKYCECFEYGVNCSVRCTCRSCENGKPSQPDNADEAVKKGKKPAAEIKVEARSALAKAPLKIANEKALAPATARTPRGTTTRVREDDTCFGIKDASQRTPPQTPLNTCSRNFMLAPFTPVDPTQAATNLIFTSNAWPVSDLSPALGPSNSMAKSCAISPSSLQFSLSKGTAAVSGEGEPDAARKAIVEQAADDLLAL